MLEVIRRWAPFRIDALGIVTIVGAEEVDRAIGRLVPNNIADFLPLLGAFVICGNRFVQPVVGNAIYNVTDGIMATDVAGWFSRWLLQQDPKWNTTSYIWEINDAERSFWRLRLLALFIGLLVNLGLVTLAVLLQDWFGLANAISMTISVIVRSYLVHENRQGLDRAVARLKKTEREAVKVFCTMSDGKGVTLHAPRGIVMWCFLTTPKPAQPWLYNLTRSLGWLGFACHVICIGQSTLFIQILTTVIMIVATVLVTLRIGCDGFLVCSSLSVTRCDLQTLEDRRTPAYAKLDMLEGEENAMVAWGLMPQKTNILWWTNYRHLKEKIHLAPTEIRSVREKASRV